MRRSTKKLSNSILLCWPTDARSLIYRLPLILLSSMFALTTGCGQFNGARDPKEECFYLNPKKDITAIGRAAVVELENESSYPDISTDTTDALFHALQKKQVFGLFIVRRQDPLWRSLQIEPDLPYTLERLLATQTTLKCDAILVGAITHYQPYPHLTIGLRIKLVDLKDGELLWAIEQVWDAADKTIEYRIKHYLQHQTRSGTAPLREELATVSTLDFTKFVAYEVAETLEAKK